MTTKPKLSVVVPALDEEENLEQAIATIHRIAQLYSLSIEIIVVNDGSTDHTAEIAEKLADKVIHHQKPQGLGNSYFDGVNQASGAFVVMLPGDNEVEDLAIQTIFKHLGAADVITTFPENTEVRHWGRRILAKIYTRLVRNFSSVPLRYFNGPTIYRTDLVQKCRIRTDGFGYNAEILAKLLRNGTNYLEIPMRIKAQPGRRSRAFRLSNWFSVGISIFKIALRRVTS